MTSTIELLEKALKSKRAATWCKDLNISSAAFAQAKMRGRLSPVLAGNIAMDLGEDASKWMAVAALEAERESPLRDRLRERLLLRNQ
ncbi:hypothetical protein ACUTR7_09035 [Delftia sp. NA_296.1]|uniref:hypothetical protein n=1 Tax=Delftia TaxID=80865 RepID=UPI000FF88326|nr:hypothetical protein [Delftia tsuruhatensis]MBL8355063.1 hypothetical protein [Delftia acidovorans]